ncbi:MAG: 50S ribosomal protein L19e [Candidatus Anstonellales archaeon]
MTMKTAKRIASDILGVGISSIRIKPESIKKVSEALTREDIRSLIKDGSIYRLPRKGVCRIRAKKKHTQIKKGRRRGLGSRKGKQTAREMKKRKWILLIRAERKYLRNLLLKKQITNKTYRKVYLMAKGGFFSRGRSQILQYLKDNSLLTKV